MASPARQQYLEIKRRHPDDILLFRLGDFYEMFDEDAETAAAILGIQLTARSYPRGEGRVPMAGVPFHSVHGYIKRLLDAGHRVAVCDQLTPAGKGLVERDVVRVFTPGTLVEPDMLRPEENNYLAGVSFGKSFGLAYVDITTGVFEAAQVGSLEQLESELLRLAPAECIVSATVNPPPAIGNSVAPTRELDARDAARLICSQFSIQSLGVFGLDEFPDATVTCALVLDYLGRTNRPALELIDSLRIVSPSEFMVLDRYTRASLELMPARGEDPGRWTLLKVLDRTRTGMGARRLRSMLSQPLIDPHAIGERLDRVQVYVDKPLLVRRLAPELSSVGDIERLVGRVIQGRAMPTDLNQLRLSLEAVTRVLDVLAAEPSTREQAGKVDACASIRSAISLAVDLEGGNGVRPGYNSQLDELTNQIDAARNALAALEKKEIDSTGVKTLRVGYNKVFGYYFETGKAAAAQLPERFVRQQTLLNAERFLTAELKELEARLAQAKDEAAKLEDRLLEDLIEKIRAQQPSLMATAAAVAEIDAQRGLAEVAISNNYCRPVLETGINLEIMGGRHPVVEVSEMDSPFVPNDCRLNEIGRIIVLTGPNMGGKSTMLRTVALIVLMAQIGSFVPAKQATIGIVDRIFSRVGAQDDIASGRSTFMTEMIETANILHNATARSLLILDEIGRGTSTYDGLAIARAVIEFIHARVGARTLFATHYHELAALEDDLDHVVNLHTEIAEHEGKVVFLHRITPGSADRSYGIHVARLAGLPHSVTVRADRLLRQLEKSSNGRHTSGPQLAMFADPDLAPRSEIEEAAVRVLDQILALDLSNTTPLEALERLNRFQAEGRSSS